MDPRDPRAFGYVYNTSDDRHQFWAIKTEGLAQSAVLALRDLFEEAYKLKNNPEKDNVQVDQIKSIPVSLDEVPSSGFTPEFTSPTPIHSSKSVPPTTQASTVCMIFYCYYFFK
jgi:hypothetical protein